MTCLPTLDDYRWLVSAAGQRWLANGAELGPPNVARVARLRRELSASQTHLVLEQIELRRRGQEKFAAAERMFFTRQQLEQATDEAIAAHKASRFPRGLNVVDLCCGIGGDLLALGAWAKQHGSQVRGIDRDPATALLAAANCRALGLASDRPDDELSVVGIDVCEASVACLAKADAWHIDPDRRAAGKRGIVPARHSPPLETLEQFVRFKPNAAIKLAPAAEAPPAWRERGELEWISRGGECKQLVVWHGDLAQSVGARRATVTLADGKTRTLVGHATGSGTCDAVTAPRQYVYEPDAAVIAAGLTATLCEQLNVTPIDPRIAYLTGERLTLDPLATAFEVLEFVPFHIKRLKGLLRERGIGRLEIKKRGVPYSPEELQLALRVPGDEAATLLLLRQGEQPLAILARRVR